MKYFLYVLQQENGSPPNQVYEDYIKSIDTDRFGLSDDHRFTTDE